MTADHTPERLSTGWSSKANAKRLKKYGSTLNMSNVELLIERIADYPEIVAAAAPVLTARLADQAARLAAVEALAREAHEAPIDLIHERCPAGGVGPGRECTACSAAGRAYLIGVEHVQRDIRAAVRADPSEPA